MAVQQIRKAMEEADRVIDASESQLAERRPAPLEARVVESEPTSILAVISKGIDRGMTPEALAGLYALHERDQARKAEQAFNRAMAAFKAERPPIVRRTENSQFKVNRNGVSVNRRYASLEDIDRAIGPTLAKHGLSYGWGDCRVEGTFLTLPCIVSHIDGHSISRLSMPVQIESRAGASDQQKVGIAQTYAMRYSLKAALGLTDVDEDDTDGQDATAPAVTPEQVAEIQDLLDTLPGDKAKHKASFLKWLGVASVADVPASRHAEAVTALKKKHKELAK